MLVAIGIGPSARAQAKPPTLPALDTADARDVERAKMAVALGQQLYDEARYEGALVAFQTAYDAHPLPEFQYDMALCHERLGHTEAAIAAFEAYLVGKPDADDRASVEHRIAALREQQPPSSKSPTVPDHGTIAMLEPPPPFPRRPDGSSAPAPTPIVDRPDPRARPLVVGGVVAFSLGLAVGIGGGLGFGLPAARRAAQVDAALADDAAPEDRLTAAQARSLAREADRLLALQLVSVGVGVAGVVTGTALIIAGKRRARASQAHARISPTPFGITIAGSF